MATSRSPAIGLFILHFNDVRKRAQMDILFIHDPNQTVTVAGDNLEKTVIERLGRMYLARGSGSRIESLSIVGPNSTSLEITFLQLATFIRTLPSSAQATKPNLFGLGSNTLSIKFKGEQDYDHYDY